MDSFLIPTKKLALQEYVLAEKGGRYYDLTYDSSTWDHSTIVFSNQNIVAQERGNMDERGLRSCNSLNIFM